MIVALCIIAIVLAVSAAITTVALIRGRRDTGRDQ